MRMPAKITGSASGSSRRTIVPIPLAASCPDRPDGRVRADRIGGRASNVSEQARLKPVPRTDTRASTASDGNVRPMSAVARVRARRAPASRPARRWRSRWRAPTRKRDVPERGQNRRMCDDVLQASTSSMCDVGGGAAACRARAAKAPPATTAATAVSARPDLRRMSRIPPNQRPEPRRRRRVRPPT